MRYEYKQYGTYTLRMIPSTVLDGEGVAPRDEYSVGDMLALNFHFAVSKNNTLYWFKDGVYKPAEENCGIYDLIIAIAKRHNLKWGDRKDTGTVNYLVKTQARLEDIPYGHIINMKNGIYFIDEGRFEPHEEEFEHWKFRSTVQIPIVYDPAAKCGRVDKFLDEVFPGGKDLLYDLIGICMTSDTSQHKAVMLLGDGNNGKSLYLYGLRAMVGVENFSSTTLHQLCDSRDRFCNSDLVGKLVNASDDTRMGKIMDTANIKSIISGNPIRMEAKHKDAVSYKPFCKMIFATNHRIESEDETFGFLRRFIHIPFARRFGQDPNKQKELERMWDDPMERSGVFNEIVKRLKVTLKDGFHIPDDVRHLVETYDPTPDESKDWFKQNIIYTGNSADRISAYKFEMYYFADTGRARKDSREALNRYMMSSYPHTMKKKARVDGGKIKVCWIGVKWVPEVEEQVNRWIKYPEDWTKTYSTEEGPTLSYDFDLQDIEQEV